MNRNFFMSTMLVAGLSLSAGPARAQEAAQQVPPPPPMFMAQGPGPGGPGPGGPGGRFGGPVDLLGFGGMHGGKVVKGAPFSAVAVSESTQTLSDGNHITHKTQTNLFRDGQGRFRKEVTIPAIGPLTTSGQPQSFVILHDPVAGVRYTLENDKKVAWKASISPEGGAKGDAKGNFGHHQHEGAADETTTTDLGTQTIAGVTATGTRTTQTIPAGKFGNEKAIISTFEEWYSNDLQMVVMSKRSDPRFGDTTYTLTNVQRQEPTASLFAVPADFTVKQGGGHPGGRRHGHHGSPPAPPADGAPTPST
jgi:hypothetical protein